MAEVTIQFKDLTKDQMEHLHKAESELSKAGVSFDTSFDFGTNTRDWEFDWSLEGARVVLKKAKHEKEKAEKN